MARGSDREVELAAFSSASHILHLLYIGEFKCPSKSKYLMPKNDDETKCKRDLFKEVILSPTAALLLCILGAKIHAWLGEMRKGEHGPTN